MMIRGKNFEITHRNSDIDFNVYFDYSDLTSYIDINGIYLIGHQVDLIEVIDEDIIEDLEQEIEERLGN